MRLPRFLSNSIAAVLCDPRCAGLAIAALSAALIFGALYFEHAKGLEPCILCLYQRIPHAITFILGILAAALSCKFNRPKLGSLFLFLSGLVFLSGAVLAIYHVGVEQHWWVSAFEACAAPGIYSASGNLLQEIESTAAVRCDIIPWSLFGISMAGYNALISFGMAIFSIVASICSVRKANGF